MGQSISYGMIIRGAGTCGPICSPLGSWWAGLMLACSGRLPSHLGMKMIESPPSSAFKCFFSGGWWALKAASSDPHGVPSLETDPIVELSCMLDVIVCNTTSVPLGRRTSAPRCMDRFVRLVFRWTRLHSPKVAPLLGSQDDEYPKLDWKIEGFRGGWLCNDGVMVESAVLRSIRTFGTGRQQPHAVLYACRGRPSVSSWGFGGSSKDRICQDPCRTVGLGRPATRGLTSAPMCRCSVAVHL